MARTAIDYWYKHMVMGEDHEKEIALRLRGEVPPMLSWIVRGGCAVQCQHCIFPFEGPKAQLESPSTEAMLSLLGQLSGERTLVHEGRQLLPSQVPTLAAIKRAGHRISLINNGQYVTPAMLSLIEREGLEVDALDVSVDGTESNHNAQRSSDVAWSWAMKGIGNARRILSPKGKLTSLYTLTPLNCATVKEAGEMIVPLVDEWHLTTMSLRPSIKHMRASKWQLGVALEQLLSVRWEKPVFMRTYSLADFVWLLEIFSDILGKDAVLHALDNPEAMYNALVLNLGVPVVFYPKSLQINETLALDADGWWRLPFCIHYTLDELKAGRDKKGRDITHFSVTSAKEKLNVRAQHAFAAETWWSRIGRHCFNAEEAAMQQFLERR